MDETAVRKGQARRLISERARHALQRRRLARAPASCVQTAQWRDPRYHPVIWQNDLGDVCDEVVAATFARQGLMTTVSAPPRHGKTEMVGRAMPLNAYLRAGALGERMSVLYATASGPRAEEVSHRVRTGIEQLYAQTGDPQWAPGRTWTTTEWETRGGHQWVGLGWESSTGGIGCRLLIMDDLIGTSERYRSATTRRRIWRVVQEDLLSRIMSGGSAVHMETRRGTDDTTAGLLREFGGVWRARSWRCWEPDRGYLWPEEFGSEWRARNPHLDDTSPTWRSLYQQEPVPEGGTLIRPHWLDATYQGSPEVARQLASRVVVGVDLAATGKTTSDHSCFVVMAVHGAHRDVLDVQRFRAGYVEQRARLRQLVEDWRPDTVLVELAAGGDGMVDELSREIPGLRGERATRDKVARLTPWLPVLAALQVRLPEAREPWVRSFRAELEAFAGIDGEPDDQVDALVWALEAAKTTETLTPADVEAMAWW